VSVDQPVLSDDPVLQHDPRLPDSWWRTLSGRWRRWRLDTDRVAVRQQYMDRAIPEFVGIPAPAVTRWTAAHSDLHWANVTAPLRMLDWSPPAVHRGRCRLVVEHGGARRRRGDGGRCAVAGFHPSGLTDRVPESRR
ncbi:MAG TPA: hypothetical protein VLG91_10825, partial [Streptomyces sp.]|nr:hypothetical protein [Streptomyces sp.]